MIRVDKAREQLVKELETLRQRVAELEEPKSDPQGRGGLRLFGTKREITEWKKTEERYKLLAEHSADIIYRLCIKDECYTYVTPSIERILGYTYTEALSLQPKDVLTSESYEKQKYEMSKDLMSGVSQRTLQLEAVHKDGHIIPVEVHACFVNNENGEPVEIVGVVRDVTERKRAEDAQSQTHRKYRALFEEANDAIFIADTETGCIIDANKEAERLLGRPREEIIGMDQSKLHPAAKEDYYQKHFRNHTEEEHAVDFDAEVVRKDGTVVPVSISANTLLIDGKILIQGIFRDVSKLKQAQERIQHAAEEWRRTFDSITDFVSIQDKDFRIIRVNKAYADLFKKKPQELLGKTCYELMHNTDQPVQYCPHQKTLQTGRSATEEFFESHLGIFLEMTTSPVFDEKGNVISSVHVARDITKRKQMEQQLILNGRLASVGELAAGVAHELNNPLTSVIGFSQLLMEREIPDDIREDLSLVHSEAQRAAGIVKNLLTFARQYTPVKQLTRIENVIEAVLRLRTYEQKVNRIEVVRRFATDLPEVMVDYSQMEQVFLNIIINAEYFMTEAHGRGTLIITAEKLGSIMRISFADDGPGISNENLSQLFNPFFTTKEVGKGTGLGLSICHGIVTEHRGKIYTRSQVGTGATFVIELPVDSQ